MMMGGRFRLLLVLAVAGFSACSRGAPPAVEAVSTAPAVIAPGEWTQDLDAALALGKQEGLLVFMNFMGSDWCGVCIQTEKSVFKTDNWAAYAASNFVMVALDFPENEALVPPAWRARNEALRRQLQVEGFPTFIIVDPVDNTPVARLGAYRGMTAEGFIQDVRRIVRLTPGAIAHAEAGLVPETLTRYREIIARLRAAQGELDAWLKTQPERNEENLARHRDFLQKLDRQHDEADQLEGVAPAPSG